MLTESLNVSRQVMYRSAEGHGQDTSTTRSKPQKFRSLADLRVGSSADLLCRS